MKPGETMRLQSFTFKREAYWLLFLVVTPIVLAILLMVVIPWLMRLAGQGGR